MTRSLGHGAAMASGRFLMAACLVGLLAGCGNAPKYYAKHETETPALSDDEARRAAAGAGSKVIVLRWPALVAAPVRPAVVQHEHQWLGVSLAPSVMGSIPPFPATPDILEAASTLFTAELYWSIKRLEPGATILFEPQLLSPSGAVVQQRSLMDPSLPADIVVDYWVKHTQSTPPMAFVSHDFNVSIQTAPARAKGNCGLLVTTIGHQPMPWAYDKVDCTGGEARNALQANFTLDGEERPETATNVRYRDKLPPTRDEVLLLKTIRYMDGGAFGATMNDYVRTSRPQRLADADSAPVHPITAHHSRLIVSSLAVPEPLERHPKTLEVYVRHFDRELADALKAGATLSSRQEANLVLVKRLMRQEYGIRAKRDEQIAREIVAGDFGRRYRAARDKAYSAYGSAIFKMWAGTFSAIALHGAALQAAGPGLGALTATNQTTDYFNQQLEASGLAYVNSMAPSLIALGSATVTTLGDSVQVDLADQAGLRKALLGIYQKHRQ